MTKYAAQKVRIKMTDEQAMAELQAAAYTPREMEVRARIEAIDADGRDMTGATVDARAPYAEADLRERRALYVELNVLTLDREATHRALRAQHDDELGRPRRDTVKMLSPAEWAAEIGVTPSQARRLAPRAEGAQLVGRGWIIPAGTPKPDTLPSGAAADAYSRRAPLPPTGPLKTPAQLGIRKPGPDEQGVPATIRPSKGG